MDIRQVPIEEIQKELIRRKSLQTHELRQKIEEHRRDIRDLENQLLAIGETSKPAAQPVRTTIGEKTSRVLGALAGGEALTQGEIESRSGVVGLSLRASLNTLVREGSVVRVGKARGTKYRKA